MPARAPGRSLLRLSTMRRKLPGDQLVGDSREIGPGHVRYRSWETPHQPGTTYERCSGSGLERPGDIPVVGGDEQGIGCVDVPGLSRMSIRGRIRFEAADLLHGHHALDESVQPCILDLDVCGLGAAVGQSGGAEAGVEETLQGGNHIEVGGQDGEAGDYFGGGRFVEIYTMSLGDLE